MVDCIKFVAKAYRYLIFLLSCSEVMVNDVRIHTDVVHQQGTNCKNAGSTVNDGN